MRAIRFLVVLMGMALLGTPSRAQAGFITSLDQLQVDGTVNWSVLGSPGTSLGPTTLSIPGMPGYDQTVTGPLSTFGSFTRLDQGGGWNGSFMANEAVIWSVADGSFRLNFTDSITGDYLPISGFGARYEDASVGPYTGRVRAFDSLDKWNRAAE